MNKYFPNDIYNIWTTSNKDEEGEEHDVVVDDIDVWWFSLN